MLHGQKIPPPAKKPPLRQKNHHPAQKTATPPEKPPPRPKTAHATLTENPQTRQKNRHPPKSEIFILEIRIEFSSSQLHALFFIRNVVKNGLVSILQFGTVVSYF